jgi:acetyl-CoA C-acetyltransferase
VDQAAAIFMTDVQTAREYGVPEEKWIYLLGSGDASDIWHVTEREYFYSSPSVKVAVDMALEQAGLGLQEIDYLEFYSCFPSAPRIARNMLGIPKDDPRPLTVAGGMPSFGGPGNNYALHAICTMAELLRQNPAKIGLVQALSWFISKHSVGIYSGEAAGGAWSPLSPESYQAELDRLKLKGPRLVDDASGSATVETFTLFHDREGRPTTAVIIGRLDDGSRFLARPEPDDRILNAMMEKEVIGEKGRVRSKDDMNIFQF